MAAASPVNHGAVGGRFYPSVCKSNHELTIFVRFLNFSSTPQCAQSCRVFFSLKDTTAEVPTLFLVRDSLRHGSWDPNPPLNRAKDDFSQSMHCASILSAATLLRQGDRSSVTGVDVEIFVMQPLGPNKVNLDELGSFEFP